MMPKSVPVSVPVLVAACMTCLGWADIGLADNLADQGNASIPANWAVSTGPLLAQASLNTARPSLLPLTLGSRGLEVAQLQKSLQSLGHYSGAVDGVYGQGTLEAVSKFQTSIGVIASGAVDADTRSRLQQLSAQATPAQPAQKPEKQPKKPRRNQSNRWLWIAIVGVGALGVGAGVYVLLRFLMRPLPEDEEETLPEEATEGWEGAGGNGMRPHPEMVDSSDQEPVETSPPPESAKGRISSSPEPQSQNIPQNIPQNTSQNISQNIPQNTSPHIPPSVAMVPETPVSETTRLPKVDIIEALIQDLQSAEPSIRRKAIWELAQRGDSRAMQPLLDLMIDSDSQQRGLILEALSQIGNRTLKPLNRALALSLQDDSSEVRKNAIRDLTKIYDLMANTQQILRHAVDDPDRDVQATVKWAMGQLNRLQKSGEPDHRPSLPSSPDLEE